MREFVERRDGAACVWCGRILWERDRTIEHLLPRSRKGSSRPWNLLPACRPCNNRRKSKAPVSYARQAANPRWQLLRDGLERLRDEGSRDEQLFADRQLLAWTTARTSR